MLSCFGCGVEGERTSFDVHDKQYLRSHYERVPVRERPAGIPPEQHVKGMYTLGGGKHGRVKLARRVSDGLMVAIKGQRIDGFHPGGWLNANRARDEEYLHRALDLPHVVRILDIAISAKKRYIVEELGTPITADSVTTLARAQHIMRGTLQGLWELHCVGVYHRDVKLANVLDVQGTIKLTDLGKAVAQPSAGFVATYAWTDAMGACLMFQRMLEKLGEADTARAFEAWWKSVPSLRIEHLMGHPLLCESSDAHAPPPVSPWVSSTFNVKNKWQKSLSWWPLVLGAGKPKAWDAHAASINPLANGRSLRSDGQTAPNADAPAPAHRRRANRSAPPRRA